MCLNIHPADRTVLVRTQPLVHAFHMEKVHTWQAPAIRVHLEYRQADGTFLVLMAGRWPICMAVCVALYDRARGAPPAPRSALRLLRLGRVHHRRQSRRPHERRLDGYVKVGRRRVHLHIMMHMVVDMLPVTGKNTNSII